MCIVAEFSIKDRVSIFFLRFSYYSGLPLVNFTWASLGKRIGKKKKIVEFTLMKVIFRNYPFFPKINFMKLQAKNKFRITENILVGTFMFLLLIFSSFFEKNINESMTNELLYILLLLDYLTKHVSLLYHQGYLSTRTYSFKIVKRWRDFLQVFIFDLQNRQMKLFFNLCLFYML